MDTVENILIILLFSEMLLYGAAIVKISQYVEDRGLVPWSWWRKLTGLVAPWNVLALYISDTRKEYGRVGLWFKLLVGSFSSLIITAIALAVLNRIGN
jgi:hypothetical protein